ncbi:sensor histidine kinase [Phragmitibacter flavus]|uniref:Sensor histidine kinase n=2 Tax=Phragmitibacter flavus TaxID=2576071 RepID=A0A5R8KH34_9BACT|nr:sensor histidine kinase [Phragmitibacter flavus]
MNVMGKAGIRWSIMLAMGLGGVTGVAAEVPVLRTALEVRSLPVEEAEKGLPVEIRGTVIFVDLKIGSALIQDDTAGTYFRGHGLSGLRLGDEVEVKGITFPGLYLTGIEKASYKKLGQRQMPEASTATYGDLLSGRFHYQLVAVEGVVHAAGEAGDGNHATLLVAMNQDLLEVQVFALPEQMDSLVDSYVRIEGLAAGAINHRRQLVQPVLWMQDWDHLKIVKTAPAMDEVPAISGSKLLAFKVVGQGGHRVRVTGTVVAAFPDGDVYIRDEDTAIRLRLQEPDGLRVGTRIEAVGFPKMQQFNASLTNAVVLEQRFEQEPSAIDLRLNELLGGEHDNELVSISATISGCFRTEEGHVLVLEEKGATIRAQSPVLEYEPQIGTRVRVTGICQVEANEIAHHGVVSRPRALSLRCRSGDDVMVLKSPSWWTAQRLAMIVGVLLLLVSMAALWIAILQRQVSRQTSALRRRIEREAALEERHRIAREFHDTLEQGLTGLMLRLEAVQARGVNDKSGQLLRASRGLVSQMQAETRSLVSGLREPSQEGGDLVSSLRAMVEEQPAGCGPQLTLETDARLPLLPSRTIHHLRMIAREGVTNALKHADAREIRLMVEMREGCLCLKIVDDGRGFDPEGPCAGRAGHFGCVGIEERCEKIGAVARWLSIPGKGTTLEIKLPMESSDQHDRSHLITEG